MCDVCMVGKVKQKNLSKTTQDKILKGQIWMYRDITTLIDQMNMLKLSKSNWCVKALELHGIKFSNFYKKKEQYC